MRSALPIPLRHWRTRSEYGISAVGPASVRSIGARDMLSTPPATTSLLARGHHALAPKATLPADSQKRFTSSRHFDRPPRASTALPRNVAPARRPARRIPPRRRPRRARHAIAIRERLRTCAKSSCGCTFEKRSFSGFPSTTRRTNGIDH